MSETTYGTAPHENPCCPVCGAMLGGFSVCQPGSATRYCSDACAERDAEQHRQSLDDSFTRADKLRKAEAEVERLRKLLKRARPHVQQAGDGGLVPAHEAVAQDKLLSDIDKALKGTGR